MKEILYVTGNSGKRKSAEEQLKNIIVAEENDDNSYLSYPLNESQIIKIEKLSKLNFDIDYTNYVYLFC